MRTSKTFNIYFWLKSSAVKQNGRLPIYVRIAVNGKRADISLKRDINEKDWNKKAGRMNSRLKNSKVLNNYLDLVYNQLLECHRELLQEKLLVSAQTIKQRYLGTDKPVTTLREIIKYHTERELIKLAQGTAKNYSATEKYLYRFIKDRFRVSDVSLTLIDYSFLVDFDTYLRNTKSLKKSQPLNNNGIMKHMERFKKIMNVGTQFGWIKKNPFAVYQLKFEEYASDFLDIADINLLKSSMISEPSMVVVRDMFLFSCYTGLSYVEVKNLRNENIVKGFDGEDWINVRRKKTNTPVKVPLLKEAKEILFKYSEYPRLDENYLLPVFSNQKVNSYLKTIAKTVGINKHLTFHVARHTFATTITLMNDVPLETVSKLLGHTKLSTTQKYARVVEKKISKDFQKLKMTLAMNEINKPTTEKGFGHLRLIK